MDWINDSNLPVGIRDVLSHPLSAAHHIHFHSPVKEGTRTIICYDEQIYRSMGWCITNGGPKDQRWGICSTSCKHLGQEEVNDVLKV